MNFEFLPEANEEFREASRYYENEAPGVGLAFIAEVHRVIINGNFPSPCRQKNKRYYPQQSTPSFSL
jgi:hypothetical protein